MPRSIFEQMVRNLPGVVVVEAVPRLALTIWLDFEFRGTTVEDCFKDVNFLL